MINKDRDHGRKRLLIVEDDPVQLEEYRRVLNSKGYVVTCAKSAEEAISLADSNEFDAILTDNVLPGMTGLRAISEFQRRSKAPIALMTSHPSPDLHKDALLLGAAAFFKKPLDFKQVCRELDKAVAG